ncbi:MAG: PAS domain S-box protein [Deltaproteobacteria bacterium]|nr:PAS domain S-box protein [Deltaproteobacteria bacterium]
MNSSSIIGLVNNGALLLALALIYDMLGMRPRGGKPEPRQLVTGMIIGLMGIAVMMNPWQFAPGIVFDTRSVLLSMSGLFFGTVPTLLAALMTAGFRLSLGGAGAWPAVAAIAAAAGIGLAWRHLRRNKDREPSIGELFLLGVATHVAMLLCMLLLLPWPVGLGVVRKIGLPVMLIYPLSTVLLGRLMSIRGERRRMEAALQKSEKRHRTILHTAMNGFLMTDTEGRILEVNHAYCRLTGYSEAELLTMHIHDLDAFEEADDSARRMQRIAEQGQDRFMSRHRRKDGSIFDVEVSAQYSAEEGGHFVAFVEDISERIVREQRLKESEERFRMIAENSGSMIGVMDALGNYEYVNPAHRILGYEPEELVGTSAFALVHPGDVERLAGILHQKGPNRELSRTTAEYRAIGKDGSTFIHEGNFDSIRNSKGELRKIVFVCDDITERKRVQDELVHERKMLAMVIEGTRAGTWEWYVQTGETVFNDRWAEMLGYTLKELQPISIRTWMDLCHPEDLERSDRLLKEHFSGKLPYYECEFRMRHKDGRWVWIEDRGKVVKWSEQGAPLLMTGTHLDVRGRKEAEAERLVLERRLQQVEKAESLSRMAGAVAHHFNNLLGAVMGNLELARMDLTEGEGVAKRLTEAHKATRRAADMSRLMLTFLGQTPSSPILIDLSKTCLDRLAELRGEIPDRVAVETDLPMPGLVVKADSGQIGQVLAILVTNAWEAMGDAGVRIRVSLSTANRRDIRGDHRFPVNWQPSTDVYACLTVSDSGSGISPAIIDRIFDPFFTEKFTGRGLGLAVALGIVKSFKGCIAVESHVGTRRTGNPDLGTRDGANAEQIGLGVTSHPGGGYGGSVFRIFLPMSSERLPETVLEKPVTEQEMAVGGVILLVEDQKMVRDAAEAMLEHFGFEVLTAGDGIEAVNIFRDRQADIRLVLTDLSMPRMNGWETLKALRKIRPDIPVILASGYDEARAMCGDHADNPQVFLSKPYQMASLKAAVNKALGEN